MSTFLDLANKANFHYFYKHIKKYLKGIARARCRKVTY